MVNSTTIVIACHEGAALLRETLSSCIEQELRPQAIIVVDDGSSVPLEQQLADFDSGATPIRHLRILNQGPSVARNIGLGLVTSDLVWFLDGDDLLMPRSLAQMTAWLEESDAAFVVGREQGFTTTELDQARWDAAAGWTQPGPSHGVEVFRPAVSIYTTMPGSCNNVLMRTGLARRAGGFHPALKVGEDAEFLIRLAVAAGDQAAARAAGPVILLKRLYQPGARNGRPHQLPYVPIAATMMAATIRGHVPPADLPRFRFYSDNLYLHAAYSVRHRLPVDHAVALQGWRQYGWCRPGMRPRWHLWLHRLMGIRPAEQLLGCVRASRDFLLGRSK